MKILRVAFIANRRMSSSHRSVSSNEFKPPWKLSTKVAFRWIRRRIRGGDRISLHEYDRAGKKSHRQRQLTGSTAAAITTDRPTNAELADDESTDGATARHGAAAAWNRLQHQRHRFQPRSIGRRQTVAQRGRSTTAENQKTSWSLLTKLRLVASVFLSSS